jgi:hypothetical protein
MEMLEREIWKCTRCGTVHDFEEDEEPLAWFYCTLSNSPNDMSTNKCGGLVKPFAFDTGTDHG